MEPEIGTGESSELGHPMYLPMRPSPYGWGTVGVRDSVDCWGRGMRPGRLWGRGRRDL